MAALYWHSLIRSLDPDLQIAQWMSCNEHDLQQNWGFSNVRRSELDVTGVKNNVFVSISYPPIDTTRCWTIVMGSGDNFDITKNTVEELAGKLPNSCFTL